MKKIKLSLLLIVASITNFNAQCCPTIGANNLERVYTPTHGHWCQDPLSADGPDIVYAFPSYNNRTTFYSYPTLTDFNNNTNSTAHNLPSGYGYDGTGHTVYNGFLYYNKTSTNSLVKFDISNGTVVNEIVLPNAGFRNTYHYQWGGYSDIDISTDENGLWATYATASNSGKIVVSKIDTSNLNILQTWNTNSEIKTSMGNSFIAGGKLYCIDSYNPTNNTINYIYDFSTSTGTNTSCSFTNASSYMTSCDYNYNTSILEVWNNNNCYSYSISNVSFNSIDTQTACSSFTWIDGNTYTASNNTATHTLTSSQGCDSVVTLNLTINNSSIGTDNQTACDSFTWIDGNTYTASNNSATHTLTNSGGCDSVVTLNLTINNSTTGTDNQIACDTYTWLDGNTYTASNNTATHTLTSSQGCDSVVTLNLTINNSTTGTDNQTACDSYTWIDGNTYTVSNNTATHTITNSIGCDSIVTLNLTINNSTTGIDVQTACDSFTWLDGNTYTASNNTATHTLMNSVGCDSIVTLNLTISNSTTSTDNQTACNSYTWIDGNTYTSSNNTATHTLTNSVGCDSIVTLNLTIITSVSHSQSITICAGEIFSIGNDSFNSSGTYTTILPTQNGCDSVVTTNLTVEQEIDTYVERQNAVFTVNNTSGATYQWLDCNNNFSPISGETNTTFTASETGSYAVAVTLGNCTDTSICNELPYIVNVKDLSKSKINIYPNPVNEQLTIDLGINNDIDYLIITDLSGKIIRKVLTNHKPELKITVNTFKAGVYFIKVHSENEMEVVKFVKQ